MIGVATSKVMLHDQLLRVTVARPQPAKEPVEEDANSEPIA